MGLLLSLAPVAAASADVADPYRGWVAFENYERVSDYSEGTEETFFREWVPEHGWAVDTSALSRESAALHSSYYYASNSVKGSCHRYELSGERTGSGDLTMGLVTRKDTGWDASEDPAVGVSLPDIAWEETGREEVCEEDPANRPTAPRSGLGTLSGALPVGHTGELTFTLAERGTRPAGGENNFDSFLGYETYQVCLTKSTIDTDGDGLPDNVDLDPTWFSAAPGANLGGQGSPSQSVISSRLGALPGSFGLPQCPATAESGGGDLNPNPDPVPPLDPGPEADRRPHVGLVCGKAKFDFHALNVVQDSDFVEKGEKACMLALSNAATRELSEGIAISTKVIMERFGHLFLATLGDEAAQLVLDQTIKKVKWSLLKTLIPELRKAMGKVSPLFDVARNMALLMVPYAAATHAKHVLKFNGCTRLLLDVDKRALRVGGGLLYSPMGLNDPRRDAELTKASVWSQEKKRFVRDVWTRRSSGLSCSKDGLVAFHPAENQIFSKPTFSLISYKGP